MKRIVLSIVCLSGAFAHCGSVGALASLLGSGGGGDESSLLLPVLAGAAGAAAGGADGGLAATEPEIRITMGGASHTSGGIYDIGNQVTNTTGTSVQYSIENAGTGELRLTGSPAVVAGGSAPGQFNLNQPVSTVLAVGATTTGSVAFSPTSTGVKTATLTIANTDSDESSYLINLMGTSTATPEPEISVSIGGSNILTGSTHNYGIILVNTGSPLTITIQNTGGAALNLTGAPRVVLGGAHASEYAVTQPATGSIAASGSTTFTATFQPTSVISLGTKNATLTIQSDDTDEPNFVINLTGFSVLSL
ncbi:MAG: choice-of-anchor D domain-containing protein [Leptospirales bacterium]|jgi:hypothetical protein